MAVLFREFRQFSSGTEETVKFPVGGPVVWKGLPEWVWGVLLLSTFRKVYKTVLFQKVVGKFWWANFVGYIEGFYVANPLLLC